MRGFGVWKEGYVEQLRHESLVKKYAHKLLNGVLNKLFLSWVGYVGLVKRHRVIVGRFRTRYLNYSKARVVSGWRSFVEEKNNLRR